MHSSSIVIEWQGLLVRLVVVNCNVQLVISYQNQPL